MKIPSYFSTLRYVKKVINLELAKLQTFRKNVGNFQNELFNDKENELFPEWIKKSSDEVE